MKYKIKLDGFGGIRFWQQRVAEELLGKAKELMSQADTLHWQGVNFEDMRRDQDKEACVENIIKHMSNFGWKEQIKEYFKVDKNERKN